MVPSYRRKYIETPSFHLSVLFFTIMDYWQTQRNLLCLITKVWVVPSYLPQNFESIFVLYVSLSVTCGGVILSASGMEVLLRCRKDVSLSLKLLLCWIGGFPSVGDCQRCCPGWQTARWDTDLLGFARQKLVLLGSWIYSKVLPNLEGFFFL